MELENRFLVLKRADIEAALNEDEQANFNTLIAIIRGWRSIRGKSLDNRYVVINLDEPYAPQVLRLMDEAERAPARAEDTARRRTQGAKDGWEIRRAKQRG